MNPLLKVLYWLLPVLAPKDEVVLVPLSASVMPDAPEGWHFHVWKVGNYSAYVVLRLDKYKGSEYSFKDTYPQDEVFSSVCLDANSTEEAIASASHSALEAQIWYTTRAALQDKYVGDYPPKTLGE